MEVVNSVVVCSDGGRGGVDPLLRIILVAYCLRGGKRDVLVDGRCRKAFLELQLSGEFAVCLYCIEKLMCEGIQQSFWFAAVTPADPFAV